MDDSPRRSKARDGHEPVGRISLITLAALTAGATLFAVVIAVTGGTDSGYGVLAVVFATVAAYFLRFRDALIAAALLTAALVSPLLYADGKADRNELGEALLVTIPVMVAISLLIAMARKRLQGSEVEARDRAIQDSLTGLANLRGLEAEMDSVLAEGVAPGTVDETGIPVVGGLVLIDLDNFSAINDRHGREMGDRLLVDVAAALHDLAAPGYTLARTAGDVFAIFAPGTTESGTKALAERAVITVAAIGEKVGSEPKLTASVGFAAYPVHAASRKSLMSAADSAMYRAKREGKDRAASARTLNPL